MDRPMTLAERIHFARRRARMEQTELGALVGVSRQQISKWENAKSVPDAFEVVRLARATGTPTEWLLADIDLADEVKQGSWCIPAVGRGAHREVPGQMDLLAGDVIDLTGRGDPPRVILTESTGPIRSLLALAGAA